MSCLWLYLSLLFTATFRQSGATSVSLNCNKTVEVVAGNSVTLNCTIHCAESSSTKHCEGFGYSWNNTRGDNPCNSDLNNCEWDTVTYVSLTISNVKQEENYTVKIHTDIGMAKSSIRVQVIHNGGPTDLPTSTTAIDVTATSMTAIDVTATSMTASSMTASSMTAINVTAIWVTVTCVTVIFVTLIVLAIFLFGTDTGREIRKQKNRGGKNTKDNSDMDAGVQLTNV